MLAAPVSIVYAIVMIYLNIKTSEYAYFILAYSVVVAILIGLL